MSEELKVALIGSAPASIRQAPYHDPSWHVWGCSPGAYGVVPRGRSQIWWELHKYEPGRPWFSPEYQQFLRDHPCVVVAEPRKEIPNGMMLDYDYLVRKYSAYFFTSSIAWMMAHAIELGYKKIGLWGVDMAANEEYEAQRAGLHFFALIARQQGIEVGTPAESDLFRPRFLYGVDEVKHFHVKMRARREELTERLQAAEQIAQQKAHEAAFIRGALDDLNYCFQTWPDKSPHLEPPVLDVPLIAPQQINVGPTLHGTVAITDPLPAVPTIAQQIETPKRGRRRKANGADTTAPPPTIAAARLGPGRFV